MTQCSALAIGMELNQDESEMSKRTGMDSEIKISKDNVTWNSH